MKAVPVQDAVGMVLCHDITQIIPGKAKDAAFKKGHIITKEDIPLLLDIGKAHIYVWDLADGFVHEDDAALRISQAVAGKGLRLTSPKEGKIEFVAEYTGLLKINKDALYEINSIPDIMLATIHTNQRVEKDKRIGGTRIIPLVINDASLKQVEEIGRRFAPVVEIKPFKENVKIGVVTTGSEVYHGRIKDAFGPVLKGKAEYYGCKVTEQIFADDNIEQITSAVFSLIDKGADVVMLTGGMSVDPDDVTPASIRNTGAEVITYGAPVLPGAMFMLAYLGDAILMGLPGCVMYSRTTVFDIVFPLILAGERPTKADLIQYAYGGFCLNCEVCTYPNCGFGKP